MKRENVVTDRQTQVVSPWDSVGAKNVSIHFFCVTQRLSVCGVSEETGDRGYLLSEEEDVTNYNEIPTLSSVSRPPAPASSAEPEPEPDKNPGLTNTLATNIDTRPPKSDKTGLDLINQQRFIFINLQKSRRHNHYTFTNRMNRQFFSTSV